MRALSAVIIIPLIALVVSAAVVLSTEAKAQEITRVIVDIKTADKRFAGTDDPIQITLGGEPHDLDDPDRDDFERGDTNRFEIEFARGRLSYERLRAFPTLSVAKLKDSFWGGGWDFAEIRIWIGNDSGDPIYENPDVNTSLDGDNLVWNAEPDDPGWNIPEQVAEFPPCILGDIDLGTQLDSDCDGIPDSDDPTFDPPDEDGDGVPDPAEESMGTDPNSPDSDGDGWWDGRNRRSYLILTEIECLDEQEDIGRDEFYITAEEMRFPLSKDLEGNWPLNDGSLIKPGLTIDSRVSPPASASGEPLAFKTRIRLREGDTTILEVPTDDSFDRFVLDWGENGSHTFVHESDDAHYRLEFASVTVTFGDPNPTNPTADEDGDGLTELKEFQVSTQDPAAEPVRIEGYDGLADPMMRDVFVEADSVGPGNRLPEDAKQMVVSQFRNEVIAMRFDDGYLMGGQELPYEETLTLDKLNGEYKSDPTRFAPVRDEHYRYGLLSDRVTGEGSFGAANFDPASGGWIVAHFRVLLADFGHTMFAQYAPILVMHEIGHTFNLCHRAGDKGKTAPASCPVEPSADCAHYCNASALGVVDQTADTAMGSDTTGDLIVELAVTFLLGAFGGAVAGAILGGAIGGLPGAIVGGIIGGILGGLGLAFAGADPLTRLVNYHPVEWSVLRFW